MSTIASASAPRSAGFDLEPLERLDRAAAVEDAGQRIGDRGAFGSTELFRQRARFGGGDDKFALQSRIGGLNRGSRDAELFEQYRQRRRIDRQFEPGAAVGDGPAIFGKVGAADRDTLRQRLGLAVRGLDQRGDLAKQRFVVYPTEPACALH